MPRKKTANQSTPVQKRVRTGCLTCRARKVKCDETKPQCKNCMRRGVACDTGVQLKWEEEFSSRGLAFGREGRWSKHSEPNSPETPGSSTDSHVSGPEQWCVVPLVQPHHFIHTFSNDFDPDSQAGDAACEEAQGELIRHVSVSPPSPNIDTLDLPWLRGRSLSPALSLSSIAFSIPSSPSLLSSGVTIDTSLLEYYLLRLCPLTTPSRLSVSSPFARLIAPLFVESGHEDVQQAVMALSARHRSATDSQWSKTAMTLKGKVIASLRRRVSAASTGSRMVWDPQILIMMMFLCLYEIVDNCDHRWVIHLRGSEDIIRRSRQIRPSLVYNEMEELTTFTERFFAYQDVISRTACGNSPLFGIEYWDDASQPSDIDSWMGCSPALVKVLCGITELSRSKLRCDISSEDFEEQAAMLEQELEQLRLPEDTTGDDTLTSAAELKRKSTLLYHHCVLYDAEPSNAFVSEAVREILEEIRTLIHAGITAGLAFPIFVAAVELDPVDDQIFFAADTCEMISGRRFVLETLEEVGKSSLSNISRTKAVVQKVWRMRDMSLDEDALPHLRRGPGTNDWNFFVGPYSSNISLA